MAGSANCLNMPLGTHSSVMSKVYVHAYIQQGISDAILLLINGNVLILRGTSKAGKSFQMKNKASPAGMITTRGLTCFLIFDGKDASSRKRRLNRFMNCMASAVDPFCMRSRKVCMKIGYSILLSSG